MKVKEREKDMILNMPQRIREVKTILSLNSVFPSPLWGEGRVRGRERRGEGKKGCKRFSGQAINKAT